MEERGEDLGSMAAELRGMFAQDEEIEPGQEVPFSLMMCVQLVQYLRYRFQMPSDSAVFKVRHHAQKELTQATEYKGETDAPRVSLDEIEEKHGADTWAALMSTLDELDSEPDVLMWAGHLVAVVAAAYDFDLGRLMSFVRERAAQGEAFEQFKKPRPPWKAIQNVEAFMALVDIARKTGAQAFLAYRDGSPYLHTPEHKGLLSSLWKGPDEEAVANFEGMHGPVTGFINAHFDSGGGCSRVYYRFSGGEGDLAFIRAAHCEVLASVYGAPTYNKKKWGGEEIVEWSLSFPDKTMTQIFTLEHGTLTFEYQAKNFW
jgi:hypothetical protein